MNTEDKFPVGSLWLTGDGHKAEIIYNKKAGDCPVVAVVDAAILTFTRNGQFAIPGSDAFDLIRPWIDRPVFHYWDDIPSWHHYVWHVSNLDWVCSDSCPLWDGDYWCPVAIAECVTIPAKFAPEWSGSRKDSLIARPGYKIK